jgi:hypothetical protein
VDIASGDVICTRDNAAPRVLMSYKDVRYERIGIQCVTGRMHFMTHHLLLYALDPENSLFDSVQRFTVFCGRFGRQTRKFGRPKDNCLEVQEMEDSDGDTLLSVCKTDGEHMLGYRFNSLWALWKCHHAVNNWFHHFRQQAGEWLHPYINEEYAEVPGDRAMPSFYESLPKTLSEEMRDYVQHQRQQQRQLEELDQDATDDELPTAPV